MGHSLKQMSYCFIYSDLPITDWIQAIGIFLGFPAALWGMIKLFKKDKERQIEISSLASLAESQTKITEKISEQIDIEKKRHLNYIMPFLNIIETPTYIFQNFTLVITNTGGRCKFKGVTWDFSQNVEFDSISGISKFIETEKNITIVGHIVQEGPNLFKAKEVGFFSVWLQFEDVEKNQYYQKLFMSPNNFFIENPIRYFGSIEESVQKTIRNAGTIFIQ